MTRAMMASPPLEVLKKMCRWDIWEMWFNGGLDGAGLMDLVILKVFSFAGLIFL